MQKLRRKIRTVRPEDRVEFGMQAHGAKRGEVPERFEDGALELAAQVDFAGEAITESQPDYVVANVSCVDEANQGLHLDCSSGAIGFRG
jgi:hypothetical protein